MSDKMHKTNYSQHKPCLYSVYAATMETKDCTWSGIPNTKHAGAGGFNFAAGGSGWDGGL